MVPSSSNRTLLANPTYGLGFSLLPEEQVGEWILAFDFAVSDSFWEQPLKRQAESFKQFLDWLVENRHLQFGAKAPRLVCLDYWLDAQRRLAEELKQGELDPGVAAKCEVVRAYLAAGQDPK
ncbi:MAG: hypothetical protein QHH02_01950 [Syntrophomonadaceae bacterium]|nr:hypothetical protein [Syntrophomonadaceae bacterium]